jgi:hypothetical protein
MTSPLTYSNKNLCETLVKSAGTYGQSTTHTLLAVWMDYVHKNWAHKSGFLEEKYKNNGNFLKNNI